MTRPALGLVLLLLVLAACGPPEVGHHGLAIEALPNEPTGDALRIGQTPPMGDWVATLDVAWTRRKAGSGDEHGEARLVLTQRTQRAPEGTVVSRLSLRVHDLEGIAGELVRKLDGMGVRFHRDDAGRAVPGTLRFEVAGPPGAEVFFDGLMFAGFGAARPWTPPRPVRVGEMWPRAELGSDARTLQSWGLSGADLATGGGCRLVEVEGGVAHLRLDALSEVNGLVHLAGAPSRAVSFGVRTVGEAELDTASGQPRRWEARTTIRYLGNDGNELRTIDLEEIVVGTVRPLTDEAPGRR